MCVGVDVVKAGRKSLIGMTASYSRYLTQHLCRVMDQNINVQLKSSEQQEQETSKNRSMHLMNFIKDACQNYNKQNKKLPDKIIVYRDGVGGPTMVHKVMENEASKINEELSEYFGGNYKP